jgi:pimeloyl-ACP methyl ester carboxylesterase
MPGTSSEINGLEAIAPARRTKRHHDVMVEDGSSVHAVTLSPPPETGRRATVILSHGFNTGGTEGGRRFIRLANALVENGYHCVLFDYRGWGYSDLLTEEMTFATETADLHAVIDFARTDAPENRLVLLGNSLGSAVASHVAAERPDISLLVLWCLSANLYSRYQEKLNAEIEWQGFTFYDEYRIGLQFLRSLQGRDTFAAIRNVTIPCLLVHGDADTTAPIELARTAHRLASAHTTLVEIEGAGHSFGTPPESLLSAIDVTTRWLNERVPEATHGAATAE